MGDSLSPFVWTSATIAGVAAFVFTLYKTDADFKNSIDSLMGWNSVEGGCCGGDSADNACCGGNPNDAACCGGQESGACCGGDKKESGCCDNGSEGGCCGGEGEDGGCCDGNTDDHNLLSDNAVGMDLEDFKGAGDEFETDDRAARNFVIKKRNKNAVADSGFLPPIYVKTFGCSHNTSDSEFMAGILAQHGYPLVESLEECALIVVNSCTVKNPSQDAFVNLVKRARSMDKKVVVAGCVPQADRQELPDINGEGISAIGVAQLERILEVVDETLQGNTIRLLGRRKQPAESKAANEQALLPSLDLPKVRRNRYVEIIPLSTGCLGACTYCKTKHARGKLGSYHPDQILRRVKSVLEEGVVSEIWLTSEDTGAYGLDLKKKNFNKSKTDTQPANNSQDNVVDEVHAPNTDNETREAVTGGKVWSPQDAITNIADLLVAVTDMTAAYAKEHNKEPVMLRLGMTNPPYMLAHKEKLAEVLKRPNVYSFLHIPVQSGSNNVLEGMVREYTCEEFEELADYLREHVPHMTIATDIICGFPGETEADHADTLRLLNKYKFPVVNISQFYARAGTAAAAMKNRVPSKTIKQRSTEVTRLFEAYTTNDWLEGQEVDCWFADVSTQSNHTIGHTKEHVKVLVPRDDSLLGGRRKVKVLKAQGLKWHVEAEVIQE